ncbi:MAG TPA: hypothetical protein VHP31_09175 [Caproicibacter sp.]|nr:hypothetical protein [Caproicibacter sp.]
MNGHQTGKFRHKVNFAAVSNTALQDTNLSLRAKGLYAMIQSYITIPNYDLYKSYLMKISMEGERAFNNAWNELKDRGYLKQYRIPGSNKGQFEYEYDLLDIPDMTSPSFINLTHKGEISKSKEEKKNVEEMNSDHTVQNVPYGQKAQPIQENSTEHILQYALYAKSIQCKEQPMLDAPDAKRTYNSKTENNKIKNNNIYSNNQSINQSTEARTDGQTDEIRIKLKNQIDYGYFEDNYPSELPGVNVLLDCMTEMLSRPFTKINGAEQSKYALKTYIDKADTDDIREFISGMKGKSLNGIKNINAYLSSSIINYLRDENIASLTI